MVVAFDKATGAEVWRSIETNSEAGYSSPIVVTAGGVRQLIVWYPAGVTSLDPATGDVWWQHDFPVPSGYTIGTPVRQGRYLLVTHGENGGLMLGLNPDRPAARLLWDGANPNRTDRPPQRTLLSTPVVAGDAVYGLSSYGEFRGLDARSGARLWSTARLTPQERWANSYLVQNGDRWFAVVETGELVIARFTPAGYEEVDRTLLLTPTTRTQGGASGRWDDRGVLWAHPAFANRHVVARNDAEVVRRDARGRGLRASPPGGKRPTCAELIPIAALVTAVVALPPEDCRPGWRSGEASGGSGAGRPATSSCPMLPRLADDVAARTVRRSSGAGRSARATPRSLPATGASTPCTASPTGRAARGRGAGTRRSSRSTRRPGRPSGSLPTHRTCRTSARGPGRTRRPSSSATGSSPSGPTRSCTSSTPRPVRWSGRGTSSPTSAPRRC